ncbi:hypothetical protein ACSLBF_04885 [Pseudoalteromonas sp. T1lg65]|uniref:hypothetical protein n=1 Tax=Pseudoalteromonas sp. T1lg65 TaxID=2077101 RepID=UPI003F7A7D5F
MLLDKLTVAGNELINVPAEEKTLLDLGVSKTDIPALLEQARITQLVAQCQHARSYAYHCESDGLAFEYLAAKAEFGDSSEQAEAAKTAWLQARSAIKSRYPKP